MIVAKIILTTLRGIKKTGIIKGPGTDLDAELRKARKYNGTHPYKEPANRKAVYRTIQVGQHPCLVIRQGKPSGKAILFLHGGGDRNTWKPEVSFARTYGKRAGMDVFYPIYPPFTEASLVETADLILKVYQEIVRKYGSDKVAVIGSSYGGLLAMQLLTWINRNNACDKHEYIGMPRLLIMNSPFGYPKTDGQWKLAEKLEKEDPFIPVGAFRFMLGLTLKTAPDTPDCLLYPVDMDFRDAPETCVFYAEEACAAVSDAIRQRYEQDGVGEKLNLHIEPSMMHCYALAPVFKESKRDFNKQIALLKEM